MDDEQQDIVELEKARGVPAGPMAVATERREPLRMRLGEESPFGVNWLPVDALIAQAEGHPLSPEEQAEWNEYEREITEAKAREDALGLVDLAEVMRDGVKEPEMLYEGLLVRGSHHVVYGQKACGKTWLMLHAAVKLVQRGETVVWLDEEMGRRDIASRLLWIGATPEEIDERFVYMEFPALDQSATSQALWKGLLTWRQPALIVIDAHTEVLAAADLNENMGTDVAKWNSMYITPARTIGAATVFIDHVGHDTSGRMVGSRHKGAQAKVEFEVTRKKPFSDSQVGLIRVEETKNSLSADIPEEQFFELGVEGTDEGRFAFVFRPRLEPQPEDDARTKAEIERRAKIEKAIREAKQPLTTNQVHGKIGGNRTAVTNMLADLAGSDLSEITAEPGPNRSILYSWDDPDGEPEPEPKPKPKRTASKTRSGRASSKKPTSSRRTKASSRRTKESR